MSDEAIHNPHDKLIKVGFGEPATAAAFLREEIPAAVLSLIDWTALRLEPGTFVDSHYRHSESDLLFSAPLAGHYGLVYLLFEEVWDEALLVQMPKELFELLLRYILEAGIDKSAFERKVRSIITPQIRTSAMTIAQQLRQEGRQEGLQKGRQEDILEALEIRFGTVPGGLAEALQAIHDDSRLRALHRAAISAASLEDFAKLL